MREPAVSKKAPRRIAQAVISSLKGGVVPRIGLPWITVGRKSEIDALLHDIDIITEGGASFRFIEGKYGSGKSFLLQTIRTYALERDFVTMDADLSPERRIYGTQGQGLATYRELIRNLSTKTKSEGSALGLVLDHWICNVQEKAREETGLDPADPAFGTAMDKEIQNVVRSVSDLVHGFDFARLLSMYYQAWRNEDEETREKVLKWFRGEYTTKTEARKELGVSLIITDADWYDYLKLFAFFFHQAGYAGLLVLVDELVNVSRIPNAQTRSSNYEKILTMYNDAMQGKASYIGTIMCGTPQSIEDKRRGVYSYEALRTRLCEGTFSREGSRDLLAPVIRLEPLNADEMTILCEKLADLHAGLYQYERTITENDLVTFIEIEYGRIGADTSITPREVIRDFIELLDILMQKPGTKASDLLKSEAFSYAKSDGDDGVNLEYAEFKL